LGKLRRPKAPAPKRPAGEEGWLVAEVLRAVIPTAKRIASPFNPANRKSKRYSVHYTPTASWNQSTMEMISAGAQDVYITDPERGRIYRRDEFSLLLKSW